MTDAAKVVGALRELARERPGEIELLDGFTDAELDAWPVDVPDELRTVLRAIGGVETEEERFAFGPRGRPVFEDGCWTLGELDQGEGSLIVGAGVGDWGPILSLYPYRDDAREVTVEAPEFVGWLAGLAARLAAGEDAPASGPKVFVTAVPSVEAAEGTDAELAALVGRGDPLTDVADLRDLPGYPCGVDWEPYFSTGHGTADTSGSEIQFALAGAGGRALLLRSCVSGDFLARPVRRHALPEDAPHRAVAELRELAARHPGFVVLEAGRADWDLDAWPVAVPEDVRVVLREIGGVTVTGLPPLDLLPWAPERAVDPELHRMLGGDGTYWPLARVRYGRGHALAQEPGRPGDRAVGIRGLGPLRHREAPGASRAQAGRGIAARPAAGIRRTGPEGRRGRSGRRTGRPRRRRLVVPEHRGTMASAGARRRMGGLGRSAARGHGRRAAGRHARGRPPGGARPERPLFPPGAGVAVRGPAGPAALSGGRAARRGGAGEGLRARGLEGLRY